MTAMNIAVVHLGCLFHLHEHYSIYSTMFSLIKLRIPSHIHIYIICIIMHTYISFAFHPVRMKE